MTPPRSCWRCERPVRGPGNLCRDCAPRRPLSDEERLALDDGTGFLNDLTLPDDGAAVPGPIHRSGAERGS